jgi:hypothetical protein
VATGIRFEEEGTPEFLIAFARRGKEADAVASSDTCKDMSTHGLLEFDAHVQLGPLSEMAGDSDVARLA